MPPADHLTDKYRGILCELISWEEACALSRRLAQLVIKDGYRPEIIVAISRGGLLPGRLLADYLNLFDLASIKVEHYHAAYKERIAKVRYPLTAPVAGRQVLLVDDVSDSGDTFEVAIRHLREQGEPAQLRTAVLHHKTVSHYRPDYFAQEVSEWRWLIYPWAVIEDLSSFLREMSPVPTSIGSFARQLRIRHGITVPTQILADVLEFSMQAEHTP